MDDTTIEILESENVVSDSSLIPLPVNFVSVGTLEHDSIRVYIKQDVYKRIEKFAKEEMSKEVGSILGSSSDFDGNVTLTVSSANADVVASMVGYETITQNATFIIP